MKGSATTASIAEIGSLLKVGVAIEAIAGPAG
jgi:hypothetical protein